MDGPETRESGVDLSTSIETWRTNNTRTVFRGRNVYANRFMTRARCRLTLKTIQAFGLRDQGGLAAEWLIGRTTRDRMAGGDCVRLAGTFCRPADPTCWDSEHGWGQGGHLTHNLSKFNADGACSTVLCIREKSQRPWGASAHVAPVIREVDSVKEHALRNLRTRNVKRR